MVVAVNVDMEQFGIVTVGLVPVVVSVIVLVAVLVVVVVIVMVVRSQSLVLLQARHRDGHVGAGDAQGLRGVGGDGHLGQAQGIHGVQKAFLVGQKLVQGAQQHVAGGAHGTFQIQCFHSVFSPSEGMPSMRLMRLARYPAPKPLSMFTTLTPLEQELSMDSRADRPPKLAP